MQLECPVPIQGYETITLGHGGGGKLSQRLLQELIIPILGNTYLNQLHDGAVVPFPCGPLAFTTDSFVVSPPFFPGGNIGTLAVHGTVNDLSMCGARPRFLSLALILEEGFPMEDLRKIVLSVREACAPIGVQIITGDIKVVEKGKGDGIFINTTGIGQVLPWADISPSRIQVGDKIILNGSIAEHGIAILSVREGLSFQTELCSDTAALWPLVETMLAGGEDRIHAMRDATRGGVASVLNEMAKSADVGIVIEGTEIPIREDVQGACEMLGFDPLFVANEGRFVSFVDPEAAPEILSQMREHPLGTEARIIGEVVQTHPGVVRMNTSFGTARVVEMLSGEQLPRIC
jgi:hydrogenase expression/formation protein HypE